MRHIVLPCDLLRLGALTRESQLRQHKQIQALRVGVGQDLIGSSEITVNITDLRRELKATDPHRVPDGGPSPVRWPYREERGTESRGRGPLGRRYWP